jgi:aspartate/methionine/tyrosine aminotransferase
VTNVFGENIFKNYYSYYYSYNKKNMNGDKKKIIKDKNIPRSIRSMVKMYPSNQVNRQYYGGLPHIGNALWGSWDSEVVEKAAEAYEDYSLSSNLLISGMNRPNKEKIRLGGGSPARYKPFQKSIDQIKSILHNRILSDYPMAAGDDSLKQPIIDFFNKKYKNAINKNNIIFTHSSTQGFTLVMEAILDYGDVVIMTAPNYGLFSFIPERVGGRVRFIQLSSKDNWRINAQELRNIIKKTNKELKKDYDKNRGRYIFRRSDTVPRVSAFVHINPHNPTGVVYGKKEENLLREISTICKQNGVFIIDDLAYSGLEYNRKNTAIPVYSMFGHFDNTITLHTLSKTYGLAGIRSGMIIANEIIISLIRDRIFQISDSFSLLQSAAMSGIFSLEKKAEQEREEYYKNISSLYYKRFIFIKSLVKGFENISNKEQILFNKIVLDEKLNIDEKLYLYGIEDIKIRV